MEIKKRVIPVVIIQLTAKEAERLYHQLTEYVELPEEASKGDELIITKLRIRLRGLI